VLSDGDIDAPGQRSSGVVTAVLWDIDGTLLSSAGAVARTFLDAVQDVCGARPDPAGLDFGGRLDPEIAALLLVAAGGRPSQLDDVLARFEALVTARQDTLRPHIDVLPGVRELVGALADFGVIQTVVTGNLESVGRFKLNAAELIPHSMSPWPASVRAASTGPPSGRSHSTGSSVPVGPAHPTPAG
jgi:beta-phosphoglucomutase-like phosphatase (HAD superfamily)